MAASHGSQQLIAPIEALATAIVAITQEMLPAFVFGTGLTAATSVPLAIATDLEGTNKEAFFQDGSAVVLTNTNKGEAINVPMTLIIDKPATVGVSVGIFLNQGLHC